MLRFDCFVLLISFGCLLLCCFCCVGFDVGSLCVFFFVWLFICAVFGCVVLFVVVMYLCLFVVCFLLCGCCMLVVRLFSFVCLFCVCGLVCVVFLVGCV